MWRSKVSQGATVPSALGPVGVGPPEQRLDVGQRGARQAGRGQGPAALVPALEAVGQLEGPSVDPHHAGQHVRLTPPELQHDVAAP